MEVKQEIETNKYSGHCKLTMARVLIKKFILRFIVVWYEVEDSRGKGLVDICGKGRGVRFGGFGGLAFF